MFLCLQNNVHPSSKKFFKKGVPLPFNGLLSLTLSSHKSWIGRSFYNNNHFG